MTDASGEVTSAARYTPWGSTLETYGTGNFEFGYFGGMMDEASGLLYIGNGQYYDPATGRFLNRDAKPNNSNPYVPFDPMGALVGPLGLMAIFLGRRKKGSKWNALLILLLFAVVAGITLSACGGGGGNDGGTPTQPPAGTPTPGGPGNGGNDGTPNPGAPTPQPTPCPTPTGTPPATSMPINMLTSGYYIPTESQARAVDGNLMAAIPANPGGVYTNKLYLTRYELKGTANEYTNYQAGQEPPQFAYDGIVYDYNYTCLQGSAKLDLSANGHYISCNTTYKWTDYLWDDAQHTRESLPIGYRWADEGLLTSLVPFHTVAVCPTSPLYGKTIQLLDLPEPSMRKLREQGNQEAIFKAADTGGQLCKENNSENIDFVDIFTGEGAGAYEDTDYFSKETIRVILH